MKKADDEEKLTEKKKRERENLNTAKNVQIEVKAFCKNWEPENVYQCKRELTQEVKNKQKELRRIKLRKEIKLTAIEIEIVKKRCSSRGSNTQQSDCIEKNQNKKLEDKVSDIIDEWKQCPKHFRFDRKTKRCVKKCIGGKKYDSRV